MEKHIDAEKLVAELTKMQFTLNAAYRKPQSDNIVRAISLEYDDIIALIESLHQEQPEYGYLSTTYIHGKKARWGVGDILAYYLCTSNEEGEIIIGKITKVEFNDEEGWVYTFEDESMLDEQSLVEEGVYEKN